jgi:hypothetical protein
MASKRTPPPPSGEKGKNHSFNGEKHYKGKRKGGLITYAKGGGVVGKYLA